MKLTEAKRKNILKAVDKTYENAGGQNAEKIRAIQEELYRLDIQTKAYEQVLIPDVLNPSGSDEAAEYWEKYLQARQKQQALKYCLMGLRGLGVSY